MSGSSTIQESAATIRQILSSSRTKERSLTYVILGTNRDQRNAIKEAYQGNLLYDLNSQLSGDFKKLAYKLFQSREEFDTDEIIYALQKGKEETIYEILFNRPNQTKKDIFDSFKKKTGKELLGAIKNTFHKYTRDPMSKLVLMSRFEQERTDESLISQAANKLNGTDCNNWLEDDEILKYFGTMTQLNFFI